KRGHSDARASVNGDVHRMPLVVNRPGPVRDPPARRRPRWWPALDAGQLELRLLSHVPPSAARPGRLRHFVRVIIAPALAIITPAGMRILVVGAGVVGLAVARAACLRGHEVVVAGAARHVGTGISSRNSEVIHAGLYYPTGSQRAV